MTLYRRTDFVLDQEGRGVSGALVTVIDPNTGAPASIFSDDAGLVPLANPFQSDPVGKLSYVAQQGIYRETVSRPGYYDDTTDGVVVGVLAGPQGERGPVGPQGPPGPNGAPGADLSVANLWSAMQNFQMGLFTPLISGIQQIDTESSEPLFITPGVNAPDLEIEGVSLKSTAGSGKLGFSTTLVYAANTVGDGLKTCLTFITSLAASSGSSLVGFIQSGAGAVARTAQDKGRESVSVQDFEAVGDGVADDTTAFNVAASSGAKRIEARGKTFKLDGTVLIQSGQTWDLTGSTLVVPGGGVASIFANTKDDWAIIGPFKIVGPGIAAGTSKAITLAGCNRWRIENPTIDGMDGWGIYVQSGAPGGTLRGDQGHIVNPQIINSTVGMEFGTGAGTEFCTITAPMISGCTTGAIVPAGNVVIQGGNIMDNTDGLVILAGANHAHGIINGVNINHNTQYNIKCVQVTNGQSFADCHVYANNNAGQGAIWLDRCKGITFDGGHLDCWIYNDKDGSSGYNYIKNMYCPGSYGDVKLLSTGTGQNECIIQGCSGPGAYTAGISINDPGSVYVCAKREPGATQSVGSATVLIFPTVAANGDRRLAYDETTGIFTVPAGQAGQYRIRGTLIFSGAGLSAPASYVELFKDATSTHVVFGSPFGTTKITAEVETELYLDAAQTLSLKATVSGTSPVFGDSSWASSLSIERID